MICAKCGSQNCQIVTQTKTTGSDFSAAKGICGWFLLGPIGLLCGLCGQKKKTSSVSFWVCGNCGSKWKA